jgi:hypothetical protein
LKEWGMDATSSLALKQLQVTTIDCNMAFGAKLFTHFDLKYFAHELEDTSSLKLVSIANSHPLELNSQQFPCMEFKAHDGEHKDALVSTCMEAKQEIMNIHLLIFLLKWIPLVFCVVAIHIVTSLQLGK